MTGESSKKNVPRRWVLAVLLLAASVLGVSLWPREPSLSTPEVMAQIHQCFKTYTNESKGERYPPKAPEPGAFMPSLEALEPYLAALPDGDTVAAYLRGECGVEVCYTGYLLPTAAAGVTFLEALDRAALEVPEGDIPCGGCFWFFEPPYGPAGGDWIYRLREGIERFLIREINNPAASIEKQSTVPVLWEMPDHRNPEGGWVLYMDGRAEWLAYPGRFPMRRFFIEGIRERMASSESVTASAKVAFASRPPSWWKRRRQTSTVLPRILQDCEPLWGVQIVSADLRPSVDVGRSRGYRVAIPFAGLVLFPQGEAVPPESEDLLWSRPVWLGTEYGWQWFISGTVQAQEHYRAAFGLMGGDDRLQVMIDVDQLDLMHLVGPRAVSFLDSVVKSETDPVRIAAAVVSLGMIDDARATTCLEAAFAEENPHGLRNAEAVLASTFGGRLAPYWAPPVPDKVQEHVAGVLLREHSPAETARVAAKWITRRSGRMRGQSPSLRQIVTRVLRKLPSEVYDKPLGDLIDPDDGEQDGQSFEYRTQEWDRFREYLAREVVGS